MSEHTSDRALDGNAAAGPFEQVFGVDLTTAVVTCAGCGASGAFAEQSAYLGGPGAVLRCPGCDHVLARMVETRSELWLEMSGSASWRFPLQIAASESAPH
jgi:hypothetical protein